jgi:hypothetical protein
MREIPAAESGRVYGSVEERCGACQVNGGDEPPCIPEARVRWYEEHHGRPCHRIELDGRNLDAYRLLGWLIHDDLKPLAPIYARELLRRLPRGGREAILDRVAHALRSDAVMARLHPDPEKGSNG